MTLTHGADVERLRHVGQALGQHGEQVQEVESRGSAMIAVLGGAWAGADLEYFGRQWHSARSLLADTARTLTAFGALAVDQADQQDETSGGGPGDRAPGDRGPGGTPPTAGRPPVPDGGERAQDDPDQRGREAPGDATTEHRNREDNRNPENKPPEQERPPAGPALGEPVPGTTLPSTPEPPPWTPVDGGAGEHGSEFAGPIDYSVEAAAYVGAEVKEGDWPDAARNLRHFLDNGGQPLEQDVNRMLTDCADLSAAVDSQSGDLARDAVADAQARGITGPVTYPVSTPWAGHYIGPDESSNWYYATGGMEYSQTGSITVYPPSEPGGAYRYEMTTQVNYRDQYNWDGTKETPIGPFTVTDAQLASLHRAGIAQEFEMNGTSDPRTTSGEIR